jgi:tetratricopeptide (TPR) repeat protein
MTTAAKLRESARVLEQRGQWKEALETYEKVAREAEDDGSDLPVLNRIGDLHMRLGETEAAVQAYRRAVDAYVEAGLTNNAIALCNKILRSAPDRAEVYLRMGQLSAAQGFLADARRSFLKYAELVRRSGDLDASFAALEEFASLCPQDTDVRSLLAQQLRSHGLDDRALAQLRILYAQLAVGGGVATAAATGEAILELDPEADLSALLPEVESPVDGESPDAPLVGAGTASGESIISGLQSNTDFEDWGEPPPGVSPPVDVEDADMEESRETEPLPVLGEFLEPPAARDDVAFVDEGLLDDDLGEESPFEPLPFLGGSADVAGYESLEVEADSLRERLAAAPHDADARDRLVALVAAQGEDPASRTALEEAHRALAAEGRFVEAADAVQALIALHPEESAGYRKQVEYAFRGGDRERLIRAYLDLANHLQATGLAPKARSVFQRVLDLAPDNREAQQGVGLVESRDPGSATPAEGDRGAEASIPPPEASSDGYVNLGALIFDEEESTEPTTRFVVREEEPSGDEDRDFAEMLARFKTKVADNIDVEDSKSHYDLGLAYKDMGLVDEAISQFQVALRGGANPLATLEVLGDCFVEKGQHTLAARVLERALQVDAADAELIGVFYLLGRCKETLGDFRAAADYFERVLALDIRFRDATERLESLRNA